MKAPLGWVQGFWIACPCFLRLSSGALPVGLALLGEGARALDEVLLKRTVSPYTIILDTVCLSPRHLRAEERLDRRQLGLPLKGRRDVALVVGALHGRLLLPGPETAVFWLLSALHPIQKRHRKMIYSGKG